MKALAIFLVSIALAWIGEASEIPDLLDVEGEIVRLEYYLNEDPGKGRGMALPVERDAEGRLRVAFKPEVSQLPLGGHRLFVRCQNGRGEWSHLQSHAFVISPWSRSAPLGLQRAEYFLGEDPGKGEGTAIPVDGAADDRVSETLSLRPQAIGGQSLTVRIQDTRGHWSFPQRHPFFVRRQFFPSHLEWTLSEADFVKGTGRQGIGFPTGVVMEEISTGLEGELPVGDRTFHFTARLLVDGKLPSEDQAFSFTVEVVDTDILVDTDEDGLPDVFETGTGVYVSRTDTGTDPLRSDSDGDGLLDGEEAGSPLDPNADDSTLVAFFAARIRAAAAQEPVFERDAGGRLKVRFSIQTSQDLGDWKKLLLGEGGIEIEDGDVILPLPELEGTTQFLRFHVHE